MSRVAGTFFPLRQNEMSPKRGVPWRVRLSEGLRLIWKRSEDGPQYRVNAFPVLT